MKISTLYKLSAVSIIVAGLLFVLIQFIHPSDAVTSIGTTQWQVAHILTFIFPIFGILGVTGIYLKQADKAGYWGLIGYLGLFGAFVLMICFGFYEAFIAPGLVGEAPAYLASALSILDGEAGPEYIGTVYQINGALYLLGALIFSITTMRAKVYPLWTGGLLLAGILATLSAALVPMMARPSAVIFGIGLVALGYASLQSKEKS
jgi:hypothetical protein